MAEQKTSRGRARVSVPVRNQIEMRCLSLDQLLPIDHRARIVWRFVTSLDLSPLYAPIKVSDSQAGRTAIPPNVILALWLLATLEGIGSARELDRRCERDLPYQWLLGGITVNHHTLSDFRTEHGDFLEKVLTDTVASLIHQGLVPLETIAQDGMRVRASAGSGSFRRKPTLEKLQEEAGEHVRRLKEEGESETTRRDGDARRRAAQERAARERAERIEQALKEREQLAAQREKRKKGDGAQTRSSTTDPEARNMKMACGGFRPAFNVQFATDADARIIVGVEVTNSGVDSGHMGPMQEKLGEAYGRTPGTVLVDSAYATKDDVTRVELNNTEVVSTVPRSEQLENHGKDPHAPQRGDTAEYAAFRQRMSQQEYKDLYKQRPSVAEFPNADCRNRNLHQFNVRGLVKVKAVALWHALAFNFTRMIRLEAIQ